MNLIIHPDELFLKGSNQPFFYNRLINNLKSLFPGTQVKRIEGGLWMEKVEERDLERLRLVPGIANFAGAAKCGGEMREVEKGVSQLLELYCHSSEKGNPGRPLNGLDPRLHGDDRKSQPKITFRISAERSYKKYKYSSLELERTLGDYVRVKMGWKVDLDEPDINIHLNAQKEGVYIYGNVTDGAGGLPDGVSGKVMCLLSGGIDSPVAAYLMMKRGAEVELVHFENRTLVSEEVSQKIFDLSNTLSKYQGKTKLHIVAFEPMQRQIVIKVPADYRMILVRRLMFKIAETVARKEKCQALVTGDSLGQVASQTLENLTAVYEATPLLKLTPLIGYNKRDIMSLARRIGTLEISDRPYEDCCSLFVAKHPQTKASLTKVLLLEKQLDLSTLDKLEVKSYHISTI